VEFEKLMRWVNRGLLSLAVVFLGLCIGFLAAGQPRISLERMKEQVAKSVQGTEPLSLERFDRNPAQYATLFTQRQLFRQLAKERTQPAETDSAARYRLLGITYDGKTYQAHLLEEKSQTYHTLRKGQFLGDYLVEDINKNRALLSKGEEQLELKK